MRLILIRMLVASILVTYMNFSFCDTSQQHQEFREEFNRSLPFSEAVILADVKAITTKIQEGSDTDSANGLIVQEYYVQVTDIIISDSEITTGSMKLITYGGELVRVDQNGHKTNDHFSVSGWPQINAPGNYIIFIEHRRKGRTMYNNNDIYIAEYYKISKNNNKNIINLKNISSPSSTSIGRDSSVIDLQDAISIIVESESLLNTYIYNDNHSGEGAYAID